MNIGILGFAHAHVDSYCSQWRQHSGCGISVAAGWDHDAQRLEKAVERFKIRGHGSAEALLSDGSVEGVVVAAETSFHAQLVELAAAAGKAVVLQKPMALTMAEADRIVAAVDKNSIPFTMAWQMRVDPQNMKMKELVQSGELGQVFMVRRRHGLSTHSWPGFPETWYAQPELNRDIWADDASHAIDFILWLLGEPRTVTAELTSLYDPKVPMDTGVALFRYPGGPLAEVTCCMTCPAAENTTEIIGEKGSIIQNYGDGPSCNVPRPKGVHGLKWYITEAGQWAYSDIVSPASHGERIAGLSVPLAEFLQGNRPPVCTAEEGRTSLRMTLACYVSSREGSRVDIGDPRVADV